ncbi:hypothetical protein BAG01nite_30250 [Brevibacillus agri]|nr:hypothetical protein [Brevibacillus agri]GED26923.1 hypothetical protein BAG01nite_30250 [Brevibacillus agri]
MYVKGVLEKLYTRLKTEDVKELISKYSPTWDAGKKIKKKDLMQEFLLLEQFIRPEEIKDFVEMAVMKKVIGLPAYTHKLENTDFLYGKDLTTLKTEYEKLDHPFTGRNTVTVKVTNFETSTFSLKFRIKEFEGSWKTGIKDLDSLTAIDTANVVINLSTKVVSINAGSDAIHDMVLNYLKYVCRWPLSTYRISKSNSYTHSENASYKTTILLDLVYNRLKDQGIDARFEEIKFKVGSEKDDVKDVTMNGNQLLTSYLACEYITLGKDIIQFKLKASFNGNSFAVQFSLKGKDLDYLKIVIVDTTNEQLKNRVMEIIQEEYIKMCEQGIGDLLRIKKLLNSIYERFAKKDQVYTEVIENSVIITIESVAKLLNKLDNEDQEIKEVLQSIVSANETILHSTGYKAEIKSLSDIKKF